MQPPLLQRIMKMKSSSGSKKTNPNKANFKPGAYAVLRSAYKKRCFFEFNLVKWTFGQMRKSEVRNTKRYRNSIFEFVLY